MIAVSPFGTLDMHGESRLAWTKLGATAEVGSDQLLLERSVDWRVGDRIVVASTDFDPFHAEDRIVTAVDDDLITLDESREYQHFGVTQSIEGWTVAYECPNRYFRLQVRSENGDDVAPLSVVRDDGASTTLVGIPNNPNRASISLAPGRTTRSISRGAHR